MNDPLDKYYSEQPVQPQLAPVEVLDRVAADEQRLKKAYYGGILAHESVEAAMVTAFHEKAERLLGYNPFSEFHPCQSDLDFLAHSEGLQGCFISFREIGVASVKRQVEAVARREGLDLALTVRDGLRAALMKKHQHSVSEERSHR